MLYSGYIKRSYFTSVESPSSWAMGRGQKGGHPLTHHAPHIRGEPGAEPLADDLLLGQGFVCSRAAPSLLCTEKSALNTRVYEKNLINFKREKRSYFSFLIPFQDLNLSHYQSKDG